MINFNTLFEDLMKNESHREVYNAIIAQLIQGQIYQDIQWQDGMPYIPDPSRNKTISVPRAYFNAAYFGQNQEDRYLKVDGVATAGDQGILIPRDAVITGLFAKSRSTGNWQIQIKRNNNPIALASVNVNGSFGSDMQLDVNLNAGDWLQFYMVGSGVDHPIAGVEIAWRIP